MADIASLTAQVQALIADARDQGAADAREERLTDADYRRKVMLVVVAEQLEYTAAWLKLDAAAAQLLATCSTGLRALARVPASHPPTSTAEMPPSPPVVEG